MGKWQVAPGLLFAAGGEAVKLLLICHGTQAFPCTFAPSAQYQR